MFMAGLVTGVVDGVGLRGGAMSVGMLIGRQRGVKQVAT